MIKAVCNNFYRVGTVHKFVKGTNRKNHNKHLLIFSFLLVNLHEQVYNKKRELAHFDSCGGFHTPMLLETSLRSCVAKKV